MKLVKFVSAIAIVVLLLMISCAGSPETPDVPAPASTPTPTPAPECQQKEEYYIRYRTGEQERYILPTFQELERERDGLARNYPQTVKGVWEPSPEFGNRLIRKRLPELGDLGVNTFHVLPKYDYVNNELLLISMRLGAQGYLTGEKAEREYIDRVVKAKKAGFAVSIMPSYFSHRAKAIPDPEAFDEFALQQAKKWAQVAEEYQVEYFSPISEYDKVMDAQGLSSTALVERVNSWNKKVLAEVSPIFTGKIVLKVSSLGLDSYSAQSASGYDIFAIAFTLPGVEVSREILPGIIQGTLNEAQEVARRDNVEWMVGEFFLHIEGRSEEQRVESFRLVFEEYKRTLKEEEKPVGFTLKSDYR